MGVGVVAAAGSARLTWLDLARGPADIREADVVDRVFGVHRPEMVFHAAALKHLPMLEQYPDEGWKTNVLVLDMGQPIRILDVAKRLIAKSGRRVEIVFPARVRARGEDPSL